jgi:hypothetical protein
VFESVSVQTPVEAQWSCPLVGQRHRLDWQISVGSQAPPQAPQWAASFVRLTQRPAASQYV